MLFLRIFAYTSPFRRTLLLVAILIAVMAVLNQAEPFVSKGIVDILTQPQTNSFERLLLLLGAFLTVKIISSTLNRITWALTNMFTIQFDAHLKEIGFRHLMTLSMAFYNDQSTGKVMSKLDRGVNRIVQVVNNAGMHFLPTLVTAIISFGVVTYYEWRLSVSILFAFIPYILINRWRFARNSLLEKQEYKFYDKQYSHFWEVLSSMPLIKAFQAEKFEIRQLKKFFTDVIGIRQEMETNTNRAFAGDIFLELWNWGVYAFVAWQTWQGNITLGTFILLVGQIQRIREPLWQLNWIFWEVKRANIGAKDFFFLMDAKPDLPEAKKPIKLQSVRGELRYDHVQFAYHNKSQMPEDIDDLLTKEKKMTEDIVKLQPVFDDLHFVAEAGQTTAFVGPSGVGKSTIAALSLRFFDPEKGAILLDGHDLRNFDQNNLRSHIGIVSQDTYLFGTTIEENLKYAKPDATLPQMRRAAKMAYIDEFIMSLPNKYKTQIGDRGVKLSGGQRQRLAIARTILRNPSVIILDEATSALDSESELMIQKALVKLLENRTALVIAHRLSTIQRADKIVVLKDRKVLEQGNHAELLKSDGLYSDLFKIQSGDVEKLKEWDIVG